MLSRDDGGPRPPAMTPLVLDHRFGANTLSIGVVFGSASFFFVVGSFVGGFIWNLIQYHRLAPHKFHLVGIIGSILGAILVLLVLRMTGTERGRRRVYR